MFLRLETLDDLTPWIDEVISALIKMVGKNDSRLNSAEGVFKILMNNIGRPNCFLLIHTDDMKTLNGLLFGVAVTGTKPAVEMMALWTKTGYGKKLAPEAIEMLVKWSRDQGAVRILAGLVRGRRSFLKWFYEPLGFVPLGIIVTKEI